MAAASAKAASTTSATVSTKGRGKTKPKTEMNPLDYDRQEGVDPRDPRASGGLCQGNHTPKSRANQFAQWTLCTRCQIRLSYIPRMGCHAQHRQAGPLSSDTKEMIKEADPEAEYYPTNKEISLQAAENSALRQLERVRRLRNHPEKSTGRQDNKPEKDNEAGSRKKVAPKATPAVTVEDSESEESPVSPGTIVVPKPAATEDLATHPGRKASRPSEVIAEQLEYQNRS